MELIPLKNPHVFGFLRLHLGDRLIVLANFSEEDQQISGNILRTVGLGRFFRDLISETEFQTSEPIWLKPYQVVWLVRI